MKIKILFLSIIFLGLLSYYLIHSGNYPLAVVNGSFIFAKDFNLQYNSAVVYYQNFLRARPEEQTKIRDAKDFLQKLRRATLDKLVENVLIYKELKIQVGGQLAELVGRKIPDFKDSVAAFYGLDREQFKSFVLEPEARREVLGGRLFLNKISLDEWLVKARQSARVIILSAEMKWNGQQVAND